MKITISTTIEDDLAILNNIYTENMRDYVEQNYPWDCDLFKSKFVADDYTVILQQREIIGFFKTVPEDSCLYLGEIQIKRDYQNKGIGTKVLQSIIQQAKVKYQRIWLRVLKGNPAIKLYQRLNFEVFTETKTHYKMQLIFDNNI
jgi:ribosomal protein S18 acetylase RimI-like enzyme